jgi:DNA-binding GntR family transcriptional regulator
MTTTLGVKAYEKLRGMLVQGRLQPGMQLVNRKLADEIGMSMTPVREAVTRLASEGLVEYVPNAGAFVRQISRQELAQLYDVRRALESLAAAEAAAHATPDEIAELRAIAAESWTLVREIGAAANRHATADQMARWIDHDQRFHALIFQAARNRWLSKVAADLKLLALGFSPQRRLPAFLTVPAAVKTWCGHRRLIRALATRDAALAKATIDAHIADGKREVFSYLAADGDVRSSPIPDVRVADPRAGKRAVRARRPREPVARRVAVGTATQAGRRRSRD